MRTAWKKATSIADRRSPEEVDAAIRQIVSRAVVSDEVVDIFAAAGLEKPKLSILSEEFLEEIREMPDRNLALELLQRLLSGEVKRWEKKNLVQSRSFAALLEEAIRKYLSRSIETAQLILELIDLARQMRAAEHRGEELGLTEEELAFYDALETNDSAVAVLGDQTLRAIAQELTRQVRKNATIDWSRRESVRAKLRLAVRKTLRDHGYPPDKAQKATDTVLAQAEKLGDYFVETEPAPEPAPEKNPQGTRQGKVVLVQHREIQDTDTGGHYTVKRYTSEKAQGEDGAWAHTRIVLRPDTDREGYEPIVLEPGEEGEVRVVAELLGVVG